MIQKLVQAYYENHMSFDGIDSAPFADLIRNHPDFNRECPEETYYQMLGYSADNLFGAKERALTRKAIVTNSVAALKKQYGVKTKNELCNALKRYNVVSPITKKNATSHPYSAEVLAVANYLKFNEERLMVSPKHTLSSGSFFSSLKMHANLKTLRQAIPEYLPHVLHMITIENDPDIKIPKVVKGVLYSASCPNVESIAPAVLEEIGCCNYSMCAEYYYIVLDSALSYQFKSHSQAQVYLRILDIAHMYGTSVKGLFEKCGFQYVNQLDIYSEVGCLVYADGAGNYCVVSPEQREFRYEKISTTLFEKLYQNNCLNSLDFDVVGGFVQVGGVRKMLGGDDLVE